MNLQVPLYDYQKVGVQFARKKRYSLNGDRMGLGKTAQALALAAEVRGRRTLILCPAFLRLNWKAEIEKFLGAQALVHFDVVSYDSIYKIDSFAPYDVVICDEVHYLKSLQAKRTQAMHSRMAAHPPKFFLGLSGTPIKNNVCEFYSLLKLCHYGGNFPAFDRYGSSQWAFNREFTHERKLRISGRKFTKWEGVKNPEGLRDLVANVYIRRRTEEVLSLPEQVRQEIVVAETSASDHALSEAWEAYAGGKDRKNFSSGKAVSALAKVPFTVEFVKGLLAEGGPVLLFTDHVQSAKALQEALPGSHVITGETPMAERHALVGHVNGGRLNILIATIASLSVGVNLTGCNRTVFNDVGWTPADIDQAEARTHRIGQKKTCFYYFLLASRVDQLIYRTLRKKRETIAEVGT